MSHGLFVEYDGIRWGRIDRRTVRACEYGIPQAEAEALLEAAAATEQHVGSRVEWDADGSGTTTYVPAYRDGSGSGYKHRTPNAEPYKRRARNNW
jgi:hypothetical protein